MQGCGQGHIVRHGTGCLMLIPSKLLASWIRDTKQLSLGEAGSSRG